VKIYVKRFHMYRRFVVQFQSNYKNTVRVSIECRLLQAIYNKALNQNQNIEKSYIVRSNFQSILNIICICCIFIEDALSLVNL
jgi:hypothetical protein